MRTKLSPPWQSGKTRLASRFVASLALALLAAPMLPPSPALAADQPVASSPAAQITAMPTIDLVPLLGQATGQSTPDDRKAILVRLEALRENARAATREERASARAIMILHMLRRQIGDERFNATATQLLASGGPLSWPEVRQAFVAVNPKLEGFFSQWLDGRELPRFTIREVTTEEQEGQVRLAFTLAQEQQPPAILAVPVRITTPAEVVTREIAMNGATTQVGLTLTEPASELLIDPDYHLLRSLMEDEYPLVWTRFLNAAKPLAVVQDDPAASPYGPLVEKLRTLGCEIMAAATAKDSDLAGRAVLFLGLDTPMVRALFARPNHPAAGLTLEVRANPLGPEEVAVLVSAASREETEKALPLLFGGLALATFAHLADGTVIEQRTQKTDMGLGWWLDLPPTGVALANRLDFAAIMERLRETRVVFVGETHDKVEDHRLQLRVIRAMHRQSPKLAIGMEMFPRPTQAALDAYLAGTISEREFLKRSNYFTNWGFDYRFYRDILAFARANKLPVVALNLEKGLTTKVFRQGGPSALTPEETAKIPAERDLSLPGYRERISGVFTMHGQHAPPEQINNFLQAQALWDETMAESAAEFLRTHPDHRLAMVVGQGHAMKDTAIPPRIARRLPVSQAVILPAREHEVLPSEADYLIDLEPAQLPPLPLLGVQLVESDKGVRIVEVGKDGAAAKAGIEAGDTIVALDGEPAATAEDVKISLLYRKKGEIVNVRVLRRHLFFPDETVTIPVLL